MAFLLSLGMTLSVASYLKAAEPANAPASLKTLINQIDSAANQRNIEQIKQFYSPNFINNDGLNYTNLEKALQDLWQQYPDLKYTTELISWQQDGNNIIAKTRTQIQGTGQFQEAQSILSGTILSQQTIQGDKLVRQQILNEKITVKSGKKPPEVDIKLPESVRPGQEFDFDVILKDPLGNNLFAGAALNQVINGENYLYPANLELELLQAGGLFKRAKAPLKPGDRWLSGVVIGYDGMIWVTQRLRIEQ
ncbi:MAG: nuclear transport factor 2 family protein [Snowella sp.]|nr:nuclear transport factor 2 family protein [Snowella sp.]